MFIHIGDKLVRDLGSRKSLIWHIKDILKKQGKNTKGFSGMKINQLKGVYYSLLRLNEKQNKKNKRKEFIEN